MASNLQIDLVGVAEQLAELESEKWLPSAGLDAVIQKLRALQGDEEAAATPSGKAFREIVEQTKAMFPGGVEVEVDCDPSDPETVFVDLIAEVSGGPAEVLAMEKEWIERVLSIDLDCSELPRLVLYPES